VLRKCVLLVLSTTNMKWNISSNTRTTNQNHDFFWKYVVMKRWCWKYQLNQLWRTPKNGPVSKWNLWQWRFQTSKATSPRCNRSPLRRVLAGESPGTSNWNVPAFTDSGLYRCRSERTCSYKRSESAKSKPVTPVLGSVGRFRCRVISKQPRSLFKRRLLKVRPLIKPSNRGS